MTPEFAADFEETEGRRVGTARLVLAIVTIASSVVFLLWGAIEETADDGSVPRPVALLLIVPAVTALVLALRVRDGIRANPVIRGQFESVSVIFTAMSLIGALTAFGQWDLPVWLLGVGCGLVALVLARRPSRGASAGRSGRLR